MRIKQQVILRGKVKRQRKRRLLGSISLILFVVWGVFLTQDGEFRSGWDKKLLQIKSFMARGWVVRQVQVEGAPQVLKEPLLSSLDVKPGQPFSFWRGRELAAKIKSQFECLKSVRVRRNWINGNLRIVVGPQSPVARMGQGTNLYLSREGNLFHCPSGVFQNEGELVLVEASSKDSEALSHLAEWIAQLSKNIKALPSQVRKVSYLGGEDGAFLTLADGTKILWGEFSQMEEKLVRLRQVWSDARTRFSQSFVADLKYFKEGKILVR